MAALTFRLRNALINNFNEMAEADQTAATTGTGWTLGKSAIATSCELLSSIEVAAANFTANGSFPKPGTLLPNPNCNAWRSTNPYTGEFANANWTITFVWRSVTTAHTGTVRIRCRVFKSADATGATGLTELTGATQVGTTSAAGSTTVDTVSTVTWSPGAVLTFTNEYLFIVIAMEIVTASGSNTADALFRTGSGITTGSRVLTSNFNPAEVATVYLALTPSGSEQATYVEGLGTNGFDNTMLPINVDAGLQDPTTYRGQSFVAPATGKIAVLGVLAEKVGSPTDNFVIELRSDSSGNPGTILGSGSFPASSPPLVNAALAQVELPTAVSVVSGTTYWIVTRRSQGSSDFSNYVLIEGNTSRTPLGKDSTNSGGSWSAASAGYSYRFIYLETGVPSITFTPSGSDTEVTVDATTVNLTLTPSASEIYTPGSGGTEYTDSATATLALTPSGADTQVDVDADTPRLTLTPSTVDTAQFVDTSTTRLSFTPSASDIQLAVDSATTPVALLPSGTDDHSTYDTGTALAVLTASGAEIIQAVDSVTTPLALTPGGSEFKTGVTVDADTVSVALVPTSVDTQQGVDSATSSLILTPSTADIAVFVDVTTTRLTFTPSTTDTGQFVDAATGLLGLVATSTETTQYTDANSALLALTGSATETAQFVDANTTPLALVPSGTDTQTATGADSGTIPILLTASGTSILTALESATGAVFFTVSGSDSYGRMDSNTVTTTLSASGSEQVQYTDAGTGSLSLTPTATETAQDVDVSVASLRFTPTSLEQYTTFDQGTALLGFTPSTQELVTYTDVSIGRVTFVPGGSDLRERADAGLIYLYLTVLEAPAVQYLLQTRRVYLRWDSTIMLARWTSKAYARFL